MRDIAAAALCSVAEAVAACAKQGYKVTATLVDTDGVTQATLRGDGASMTPATRPTPAHAGGAAQRRYQWRDRVAHRCHTIRWRFGEAAAHTSVAGRD